MINSGKIIYDKLMLISGLTKNIYPVVAPETTNNPFIVYVERQEYLATKDGLTGSNNIVSVYLYTDSFSEAKTILSLINRTFDILLFGFSYSLNGETVKARIIKTDDSTEFKNDSYETQITYNVRINS